MSHFLNASEIAKLASDLRVDTAQLEVEVEKVARKVARKLKIIIKTPASNDGTMEGIYVGFGPAWDGQPIPEEIKPFDLLSEWANGNAGQVPGSGMIVRSEEVGE